MNLNLYIANLGKYNEGELVGDWISLPCMKSEWEWLMLAIKLGHLTKDGEYCHGFEEGLSFYEKFAVHDIECDIESLKDLISEYVDIQSLNFLAAALKNCNNQEVVLEWAFSQGVEDDWDKVINIAMKEDEIPYYPYDLSAIGLYKHMSEEEKLGYTMAEIDGTLKHLEERKIESYFDFEAYGRDAAINECALLLKNGYISEIQEGPKLDWYSSEEIRERFYQYIIM